MKEIHKEGKELVGELHRMRADKRKQALLNSTPALVLRGVWVFTEGLALLVTSLFALCEGHYGTAPLWGKYILTVSGVLVLLPAAHLLSRFFRSVGEVK